MKNITLLKINRKIKKVMRIRLRIKIRMRIEIRVKNENIKKIKEKNKSKDKNESKDKDKGGDMEINCISVRGKVHNQHPAIAKSKLDTPPRNQH